MMLTPTPTPQPTAPGPGRAQRAVRLAVIALILVAGFVLLDFYRALFTDPPAEPSPLPQTDESGPAAGLHGVLLADGAWSVGETEWALNRAELTPDPLLPVPPGAGVMARRWAGGRVVAELVGPWPAGRPLPPEWEAAGWSGRPLVPGGAEIGFIYQRGPEAVQVRRFPSTGEGGCLLLVRAPSEGR
jgi:hypothetical protein